ncbi:MAG: YihY/virulence factor BrkB family protein [Gammaproteobacteria bacterium]
MLSLKEKISNKIWSIDINSLPWWQSGLLSIVRFVHIMLDDFLDGQLNLRAMSLVFTTMLSIVPLIAVSFSVMKAFGVHNQMEPMLLTYLEPLGQQGKEIAQQIMGFVDNTKVGLLSGVGLALLFGIIVRLINKIESAFNYTWRVQQSGSLARRFSNYLSVIMVGPVLVFVAMGVTGTALNTSIAQAILSVEPFGTLLSVATRLVPYVLIIAAFTFTYLFMPNTRVRFIPALIGGIAAGILWQTVGWVFATVMSASISTSYTAIYSSFAFLFVFMIWLWWSWLILLVGSSVAYYKQHPEYLRINAQDLELTNRQKEEIALQIMAIIGQRFYANTAPASINDLVTALHLPQHSIEQQLDLFVEHGLLVNIDPEKLLYTPARPLEELTLKSVIDTVREPGPNNHFKSSINSKFYGIHSVLKKADENLAQILGSKTVKDIVNELDGNSDQLSSNID